MFDEANVLLRKVINSHLLRAEGVVGLFRAQKVGDDIQVLDSDGEVMETLHGLRQQVPPPNDITARYESHNIAS